jgi:uncharacterized protein (TIGR03118 family)
MAGKVKLPGINERRHCSASKGRVQALGDFVMQKPCSSSLHIPLFVGALWLFSSLGSSAQAAPYLQTDLVSDIPGLAAFTDPTLINPWGVSHSPTSPFWISDQGTNLATLYNAGGVKQGLVVSIPTTASGPQGPTGQVFNNTPSFPVGGTPALFIFANLNGTISAWNGGAGTTAQVQATTPGAVYTGLAIAGNSAATATLYAANSALNRIDVFNGAFAPTTTPGGFVDPNLPTGLVPFNVQNINGNIYVTYALAGGRPAQISALPGMGAVAEFDTNGNFIKQLIAGSQLASPWGITLAPPGFGPFGGDLLVGNFSFLASEINAFDPTTGAFLGTIPIDPGNGQTPGGLWSLAFGNAGNNGDPNTLFFTDGINGELGGLFGSIRAVPEPSTWEMLLIGFAGIGFMTYRRKSKPALMAA